MKRLVPVACCGLILAAAGCGSAAVTTEATDLVTVVPKPDPLPANAFYVSNRPPLVPSALVKLPIGAIRPGGWLRQELLLMADGMTGRLAELSRFLEAKGNAWLSPQGEGHSPWEELPYWLKGFGDLGYVLRDERIAAEARVWIETMLASQQKDGWFGPKENKEKGDVWPNMVALNCLQSFHEATGDPRVLELMTRYFRWQAALPRESLLPGSWQKIRGGDNLESIYWLYNRTGAPFLLELAEVVHGRTADWTGGTASWHGVNICQGFREPAVFYLQALDPAFLQAAERNYSEVMTTYGQVPGGMFAADENCRPGYHDPRQGAEACSMVEFMHSFEMLARITGDPVWADRCEEVAFNSLPAALTADQKALHYVTAPNMVQLDGGNKHPAIDNKGCMLAYSPHRYRCCQHNISHGWPYLAEELFLATAGNGLCASIYAACEVEARAGDGSAVRIVEETAYPFEETVRFRVACRAPNRFPFYLRIPGWCPGARVEVNGRVVAALPEPSSYVRIERTWKDGDRVALHLPMAVAVRAFEQHGGGVSVSRGPLFFSLKIGERWIKFAGDEEWAAHERSDKASSAEWPAFEVYSTTPWNYGLVLDEKSPESSFEVVEKGGPMPANPFASPEAAPIELKATGRRIPGWIMEEGLVGLMQPSPVQSAEPDETITLVPMGAARLRISVFPVIAAGPGGREWKPRKEE